MVTIRNGISADYAPTFGGSEAPQDDTSASEEAFDAHDAYLDSEEEDIAWSEEGGSARYVLGKELVRQGYIPLDAHFSQTPIHITAHVLPNAGEAATGHADGYEEAFVAWATQYPHRIARLRDLYFRVKAARQKRVALEERDEVIRIAHNERNNANNERIAGELEKLRGEWAMRRSETETELAKMRQVLVERETTLLGEAEAAEQALWELRGSLAAQWDAEIADKRKRDAKREGDLQAERERRGELCEDDIIARAKANTEARDLERTTALEKQTRSEEVSKNASDELHRVRIVVAEARAAEIAKADAVLADAERAAQAEWDAVEREIVETASVAQITHEARSEILQVVVSKARQQIAHEQKNLDDAVAGAESARNEAAQKAGVPSSEIEAKGVREALLAYVPTSRTGAGGDVEEHLPPDGVATSAPSSVGGRVKRGFEAVTEWLCLLVFGAIFGTSLGLLFNAIASGIFKDTALITANLGVLLGFFAVGTGVFAIMGRAIDHFVTLAVESWRQHPPQERRVSPWLMTMIAVLVVLLFIAVEAIVERYGIVSIFAVKAQANNFGDAKGVADEIRRNELICWAIALIAALPFALFHVGTAWRRAKYVSAIAETRAVLADREHAFLSRPVVGELIGVQGALETARARAIAGSEESRLLANEAERRIIEQDADYEAGQAYRRHKEIADLRHSFFAEHPGLWFARDGRARLQAEMDAHPEIATAKTRYEFLDAQASVIKAWLTQNLLESATLAGQELIARTGTVAADVLKTAANSVAAPANVLGTGAQSITDAVFGFSAGNPAYVAPESHSERAAEARLDDQQKRLHTDPKVRYSRDRIKSLQSRLSRMEEGYKRRITSLKKQRRAVDLTPGKTYGAELADAEAHILSAQLQFEQEYGRLLRLSELPAFFRWFSHLRQVWLRPDGIVLYAENANRARPAMSVIAPSKDE